MATPNNISRKLVDKNFQVHTYEDIVASISAGPTNLELVDLFNELGYYTSYMDETNTTFADAGNNYYI